MEYVDGDLIAKTEFGMILYLNIYYYKFIHIQQL
jgi:hypothetical protein